MANRKDTTAVNHSHLNEFAQVVERIGLAIIGALCGFYVRRCGELGGFSVLFCLVWLFFFLLFAFRRASRASSGVRLRAFALRRFRFLPRCALSAGLRCVWGRRFGFGWFGVLGVLLQLAAGTAARLVRGAWQRLGRFGGSSLLLSGRSVAGRAFAPPLLNCWSSRAGSPRLPGSSCFSRLPPRPL